MIVIDKPAGLVVHPGAGQPDRTLLNALLAPRADARRRAARRHRAPARQGHERAAGGREDGRRADRLSSSSSPSAACGASTSRWSQGDPPASGSDRCADRTRRAHRARAWRSRIAASPRAPLPRASSASATRRWSNAASRPAAPTRSACTSQHIRHPLIGDPVYRRGTRHGVFFSAAGTARGRAHARSPAQRQAMTWRSPLPRDMNRLLKDLRERG